MPENNAIDKEAALFRFEYINTGMFRAKDYLSIVDFCV